MKKSTETNVITLPQYVAMVIKEKDLTYQDIEDRSGGIIHKSWPGKLISGLVDYPKIDTLKALAKGLGVSEDTLFRVARGLPIAEPGNTEDEQAILDLYRGMSDARRANLREYAEYLFFLDSGGKGVPPHIKRKIASK